MKSSLGALVGAMALVAGAVAGCGSSVTASTPSSTSPAAPSSPEAGPTSLGDALGVPAAPATVGPLPGGTMTHEEVCARLKTDFDAYLDKTPDWTGFGSELRALSAKADADTASALQELASASEGAQDDTFVPNWVAALNSVQLACGMTPILGSESPASQAP